MKKWELPAAFRIPIKAQIDKLAKEAILQGNIHIWDNWCALWKIYRVACCSEKQAACLMYLKIGPDDKLADEIKRAAEIFVKGRDSMRGYAPHLRRWLHNAEWEDVLEP